MRWVGAVLERAERPLRNGKAQWLESGLLSSPFLTLFPARDLSSKGRKCPIIKKTFRLHCSLCVRAHLFALIHRSSAGGRDRSLTLIDFKTYAVL